MHEDKMSWEDRLQHAPVPSRRLPREMKQAILERAQAEASRSQERRQLSAKRIGQRRFAVPTAVAAIGLAAASIVIAVVLRSGWQSPSITQPQHTLGDAAIGIVTRQTLTQGGWLQLTGMAAAFLVWSALVVILFVLAHKGHSQESNDAGGKWKWKSSEGLRNAAFLSLVPLMLLSGLGYLRAQHIFQNSDPYGKGLDQFSNSLPADSRTTHIHDGWSVAAANGTVITGWLVFRRDHPVVYLDIYNASIPTAHDVKFYCNGVRLLPVGGYSQGAGVDLYIHANQIPATIRISWEEHGTFHSVTIPRKEMGSINS